MSSELFQPSLKNQNFEDIETYDIHKLFYVAFFGGIIPTSVLCSKNAKGLKLNRKIISFMVVLSILILLAKVIFVGLMTSHYITVNTRYSRWIFRVINVIFYLIYYRFMKPGFNMHIFDGGETKPLLKDAIKWILIGIVIEFVLLFTGSMVIKYVL